MAVSNDAFFKKWFAFYIEIKYCGQHKISLVKFFPKVCGDFTRKANMVDSILKCSKVNISSLKLESAV